jgi:lipid II:glycine glycyltransferase (peptidoglycan interpeptide bridge formation enzyme)
MLETVKDPRGWNEWILRNGGGFLQSWEWGTFQERAGFAVARLRDPKSGSLALLVKRPQPFGKHFWYCPRGPVNPAMSALFKEAPELNDAVFIRTEPEKEIIRFDATASNWIKVSTVQPGQTLILGLAKGENDLLAGMHEKTRYNIRLAERKGVKAYHVTGRDENALKIFDELVGETTERDRFSGHRSGYYQLMLEALSGDPSIRDDAPKARLVFAEHDGRVLAANLMIYFGDTVTYLHGASSDVRREVMAPHFMHWKLITEAKAWGYAKYDFWGVAPQNAESHSWAGITRFKRGFGGKYVEYPGALDLIQNRFWYTLYALAKKIRR